MDRPRVVPSLDNVFHDVSDNQLGNIASWLVQNTIEALLIACQPKIVRLICNIDVLVLSEDYWLIASATCHESTRCDLLTGMGRMREVRIIEYSVLVLRADDLGRPLLQNTGSLLHDRLDERLERYKDESSEVVSDLFDQ